MRAADQGVDMGGSDLFSDAAISPVLGAAHELKSPLSLIRQLALGLEAYELSESERASILKQIILVSERGLRLTTDLTRTSRLQDSLFDLQPVNPIHVCEEVAHDLEPLYKAHGRSIEVVTRRRPTLVVAHPELLRRVLTNFADNALHYTESDAPVRLDFREQRSQATARLMVRDHGPALAGDVWQKLVDQLGTTATSLNGRPQSSGLGLMIARQFAQIMHGSIGAIRHRDGASFYVEIQTSRQLSLL